MDPNDGPPTVACAQLGIQNLNERAALDHDEAVQTECECDAALTGSSTLFTG